MHELIFKVNASKARIREKGLRTVNLSGMAKFRWTFCIKNIFRNKFLENSFQN
jgi:hypothetical protein